MPRRIAVVGQGVIGLTSAARLLNAGFSVAVISREELSQTTSFAAGAYWWPHKVYPQHRVGVWAKQTLQEYAQLCHDAVTGVHFEQHFRFCVDPDESAWVRHLVDGWEQIDGAGHGIQCHEAFLLTLPVIDVPVYLPWLRAHVEAAGAEFRTQDVGSPTDLFPEFDLVVNCTGVGAYRFCDDDTVYPIRGQSVRISPIDEKQDSMRLYRTNDQLTLVLPRRKDVVLGGTADVGNWDRTPDPHDSAAILQRCVQVLPEIAESEVLGTTVGLRPGRSEIRLESDLTAPGQPVIHNYGHGGGGYTVAWGCADEVTQLAMDCCSSSA